MRLFKSASHITREADGDGVLDGDSVPEAVIEILSVLVEENEKEGGMNDSLGVTEDDGSELGVDEEVLVTVDVGVFVGEAILVLDDVGDGSLVAEVVGVSDCDKIKLVLEVGESVS